MTETSRKARRRLELPSEPPFGTIRVVRQPFEALVFVRRGPEVLVVHRSPAGGGYWHPIPRGAEAGETALAAGLRELPEGTGLGAGEELFASRHRFPASRAE